MLPVGEWGGGCANSSSLSNPLVPPESYNFASLLTMDYYNNSDDSSFEDLNRACHHARNFIDGLPAFFFNERRWGGGTELWRSITTNKRSQASGSINNCLELESESVSYWMSLAAFNSMLRGRTATPWYKYGSIWERMPSARTHITPNIVMAIGWTALLEWW